MSENFVECKVCYDIFFKPITLPCQHTVCKKCVDDLLRVRLRYCPYCRGRFNTKSTSRINVALENRIRAIFPAYYYNKEHNIDAPLTASEETRFERLRDRDVIDSEDSKCDIHFFGHFLPLNSSSFLSS